MGRVAVDVIVRLPGRGALCADAGHERGPSDPQRHGRRVMTVQARHRMRHQLARLAVGHGVDRVEALLQISATGRRIRRHHGGVAVEAGPRLLHHLLALGVDLIIQHVGVAPLLTEVHREGVASPHADQPRIFSEPRLRDHGARICVGGRAWHRLAAAKARSLLVDRAPIAIVLQREVLAPHRRIRDLLVQSTTRKNGFLASLCRWVTLTSTAAATPASTTPAPAAARIHSSVRRLAGGSTGPWDDCFFSVSSDFMGIVLFTSRRCRNDGAAMTRRSGTRQAVVRSFGGHLAVRCPTESWHRMQDTPWPPPWTPIAATTAS
jgi:hypothetical protein